MIASYSLTLRVHLILLGASYISLFFALALSMPFMWSVNPWLFHVTLIATLHSCYLYGTITQAFFFSLSLLQFHTYSHADWASVSHLKSITGYRVVLGDSLLSLKAKKQDIISHSTAKGE